MPMALEVLQHAAVTVLAVYAGYIIVTRVISVVRPSGGGAKCANCQSADAYEQGSPRAVPESAKPLTLVRSDRR